MQTANNPTPIGTRSSNSRAGYAEWLALGAVAAGSVGAIVGMATCRRKMSRTSTSASATIGSESMTAPHGDKLKGAVV